MHELPHSLEECLTRNAMNLVGCVSVPTVSLHRRMQLHKTYKNDFYPLNQHRVHVFLFMMVGYPRFH